MLAQAVTAPQHGPRPLPLFLNMLWRETEGDVDLRRGALAGLRKYQEATRPPAPTPPACVATAGPAKLLHYGSDNGRSPVVFIPSLINPPIVLDLSSTRSLMRHMSAAGHDAYLVDWGTPQHQDAHLGLDGHVTDRLVPMLRSLPRPPVIVGYCLGGTLAIAAASIMAAQAVATIATPWRFGAMAHGDVKLIGGLWSQAQPVCQRLGYVPMEVLQSGFWAMDPARTVRKYAAFVDVPAGSDQERAFLAVEDWANQGAPLTYAAGRDLFEHLYRDDLTGKGGWQVGGTRIDPEKLSCPTMSVVSTTDRIVPADSSPPFATALRLSLGHVGMVVSQRARETTWAPLSRWLSSVGC